MNRERELETLASADEGAAVDRELRRDEDEYRSRAEHSRRSDGPADAAGNHSRAHSTVAPAILPSSNAS
jgi:hypothetical protein